MVGSCKCVTNVSPVELMCLSSWNEVTGNMVKIKHITGNSEDHMKNDKKLFQTSNREGAPESAVPCPTCCTDPARFAADLNMINT